MTTIYDKQVECSICGETSSHTGLGSTNSFGSPDLDTRPPEMERSTIFHWLQRCPSCGYCSTNISEHRNSTREIVNSEEYKKIINNSNRPLEATSFLALSYEKEMQKEYSNSAWRAIHAAWICDDKKDVESSIACRKKAIDLIAKASKADQKIAEQPGASEAITIDLMRRARMYKEALELSSAAKEDNINEIIAKVINYQENLISRRDTTAHKVSDALG